MTTGDRIVQLRKKKGLTRIELAKKLGIPQTTLRNYETNICEPRYELLIQIANEFQVSADYLIGITDRPERKKSSDTEESVSEEDIKLATRLYSVLVDSGIIKSGEDLTPKQFEILSGIVDLIAKFHEKGD